MKYKVLYRNPGRIGWEYAPQKFRDKESAQRYAQQLELDIPGRETQVEPMKKNV